jgi:hypothetical protein
MTLSVGDIVTVGRACLGNPAGARAVVVEAYTLVEAIGPKRGTRRPGWMLLFENGSADGFSPDDCVLFAVRPCAHAAHLAGYRFVSVMVLERDYHAGKFDRAWLRATT